MENKTYKQAIQDFWRGNLPKMGLSDEELKKKVDKNTYALIAKMRKLSIDNDASQLLMSISEVSKGCKGLSQPEMEQKINDAIEKLIKT